MDPFDEVFDAVRRQDMQGRATQLNSHDRDGKSLLMRALIARDRSAVLFLLAQNIELAKTDANWHTALIHAVLTGEQDWVALLLQNHGYYTDLVKSLNGEIVAAVRTSGSVRILGRSFISFRAPTRYFTTRCTGISLQFCRCL